MAFPSTIVFPLIEGTILSTGKPDPASLGINNVITLSKQQGNVAGQGTYEYGIGGVKPNHVTIRKGRINKFGLQTITAKGVLVPKLSDSINGAVVIDPKKGHVPFNQSIQMPVEWPEELMSQVMVLVSQVLGGVVFANAAAMATASSASSVIKSAALGEV